MTIAIISHEKCDLHSNGSPRHPESPQRLDAIRGQLSAAGVDAYCEHYPAVFATKTQLKSVHDGGYVDHVFASSPGEGQLIRLDGDTGMNEHSLDAALYGAGAAIMAVDKVMSDSHDKAFCIIRPPGHHAGHAHSAGFCIFNNVALAALHALEQYGLQRVAIVDFDVHHGDGTEEIVADDSRILFCSSFQHPYYPYSGADSDFSNVINLPMKAGTGGVEWRPVVQESWLPALEAFQPELVIISAGFDSHQDDDMGGFNLLEEDYVWITNELCRLAAKHAQSRVVSCLEGGYELMSLGRSAVAHVEALSACDSPLG
ncbi:MAG: histone deacetylase family protein [Thiolinea sp.]